MYLTEKEITETSSIRTVEQVLTIWMNRSNS